MPIAPLPSPEGANEFPDGPGHLSNVPWTALTA